MPQKSVPGAYPWSYSKLKSFDTCPKQYYHLKVLKDYIEPESPAMLYGNQFHKAAEDFIASDKPLPKRFDFALPTMKALRAMKGDKLPENKFGLTENMEPCGFFEKKRVLYRGIADLIIINGKKARVFDHKTGGNTKYADPGQLELMALTTFAHFPEVEKIDAALLFVVCKEIIKRSYTRDDIPALWDKWNKKYSALEAAHENDVWNPKPSGLCRKHCLVTSCEHNGRG